MDIGYRWQGFNWRPDRKTISHASIIFLRLSQFLELAHFSQSCTHLGEVCSVSNRHVSACSQLTLKYLAGMAVVSSLLYLPLSFSCILT